MCHSCQGMPAYAYMGPVAHTARPLTGHEQGANARGQDSFILPFGSLSSALHDAELRHDWSCTCKLS